jgi:hypothetical protein
MDMVKMRRRHELHIRWPHGSLADRDTGTSSEPHVKHSAVRTRGGGGDETGAGTGIEGLLKMEPRNEEVRRCCFLSLSLSTALSMSGVLWLVEARLWSLGRFSSVKLSCLLLLAALDTETDAFDFDFEGS